MRGRDSVGKQHIRGSIDLKTLFVYMTQKQQVKAMKRTSTLALVMGLSLFLFACNGGNETEATSSGSNERSFAAGQSAATDDVSQKNILQIAVGSKDHTTLVAGVQATQLEDVLANNGTSDSVCSY